MASLVVTAVDLVNLLYILENHSSVLWIKLLGYHSVQLHRYQWS